MVKYVCIYVDRYPQKSVCNDVHIYISQVWNCVSLYQSPCMFVCIYAMVYTRVYPDSIDEEKCHVLYFHVMCDQHVHVSLS